MMPFKKICLLALAISLNANAAPPLPSGLEMEDDRPVLPKGLEQDSPKLPEGLVTETAEKKIADETGEPFLSVNGFWDIRGGIRTANDEHQEDFSLGETRLQLELQKELPWFALNVTADFIYDAIAPTHKVNFQTGKGWIDLREANISFSPFSFVDIKVGRQILTWGTGDLIFINDLFPKDWQAFFSGRDVEYLKAPSDAVKASFFSKYANLDVVFTRRFDADRSITGERLSYYNPQTNQIAGRNAIVQAQRPESAEWALRLYKNLGVNELALYAYNGFWKSPAGNDTAIGFATHPDLRTLGASLRRPLFDGIANLELAYFDSRDDAGGDNPFIRNSEMRFLLGYEQEVVQNLTLGLQYYVEWMQDYDDYLNALPTGSVRRDEVRHLLTSRITWLTHNQNLSWSLFSFYSPSDNDAYFRPKIAYKVTDNWRVELGGNFFVGETESSFFGQFARNNNIYGAVRFSF